MFSAEEMGEDQMTLSVDGRGFVNVHSGSTKLSVFAGDEMIPMQYTGLHDKKGKEIYEGDIVKFKPMFANGRKDRVAFLGYADEDACYWLYFKMDRSSFTGIENTYHGKVPAAEIVGNIYESPELLKQV